jgi:flavodoxin
MTSVKKYLVAYFSKTGNNRFLAGRIARALNAEVREIRPPVGSTGLLYLLTLVGIPVRTGLADDDLRAVDEVVVCGPIWGGLLIAPLRAAIRQATRLGRPLHFATCCGSGDEDKDGRWGYAQVLRAASAAGGPWARTMEAFPAGLGASTASYDGQTRLSDDTFTGALEVRLDAFVERVSKSTSTRP